MEQHAFLWPRMMVALRTESASVAELVRWLAKSGFHASSIDQHCLLADISYLQNLHRSTASAVSRFKRYLEPRLSSGSYALGIGSEAVAAYHLVSTMPPGRESWMLPWQLTEQLGSMPVSVLRAIDARMPEFFAAGQMKYCSDLQPLTREFLGRRFGHTGEMLWYLLRGKSQQHPIRQNASMEKLSWLLPLPVRTLSRKALSAHAWRLYSMVRRNLALLNRNAGKLELGYRSGPDGAPVSVSVKPSCTRSRELGPYLDKFVPVGFGVSHLQITASGLFHPAGQMELFPE
jgi:nucleotidyltransferase/DNA polymerase involved in DNA repair